MIRANNDERTEENRTDEQQQTGGSQPPAQGPRAASERDVREAEWKADEARERTQRVEEALAEVTEQYEELRGEYEELREEHEKALDVVDAQMEWFANNASFPLGTSSERNATVREAVKSEETDD